MSWHPECYNKKFNTSVRGSPSKFETRCDAGSACLFGGRITTAQRYCVQSFVPNYKPIRNNTPQDRGLNGVPFKAPTPDAVFNIMEDALKNIPPPPPKNTYNKETAKAMQESLDSLKESGMEHMAEEVLGKPFDEVQAEVKAALQGTPWEPAKSEEQKPQDPQDIKYEMIKPRDVELSKEQENKLAANVATRLLPVVKQTVNEVVDAKTKEMSDKITSTVLDNIAELTTTTIKVHDVKTDIVKDMGLQHKQFPLLLKAVMARVNVWLAGPSGSGKTTAAQNVAKAINLPFLYTGAVGDAYALLGYKNATGEYVRTNFREAWEKGGVFLWDEVDASDPNALLAFNAALANGNAPFPDGCIDKHPDCILIAAANTWGFGATHEYVGRLKMDTAFLKRFASIAWDYDEQLEMATAPNKEWTLRVQQIRKRVREKNMRVMVTPRESYIGAQLLAAGISQSQVEEMTIRSGCTDEQWSQISRS